MWDKVQLSPYQKIASTSSIGIRPYEAVSAKLAETTTESFMGSMKQMPFLTITVKSTIADNSTVDSSYNAEGSGEIYIPNNTGIGNYYYGAPL